MGASFRMNEKWNVFLNRYPSYDWICTFSTNCFLVPFCTWWWRWSLNSVGWSSPAASERSDTITAILCRAPPFSGAEKHLDMLTQLQMWQKNSVETRSSLWSGASRQHHKLSFFSVLWPLFPPRPVKIFFKRKRNSCGRLPSHIQTFLLTEYNNYLKTSLNKLQVFIIVTIMYHMASHWGPVGGAEAWPPPALHYRSMASNQ